MFDLIIREAASRFGLGDKAGPLVQMLLAYITNKETGGIAGFMSKLSTGGLGDVAKSWLGGGAGALPVSSSQIESLLGGQGGLLSGITSKLGIGSSTASSALGFLLPMVMGKLTPGGSVPTSLSSDVMGFITGGASVLSKGVTGATGAAVGAAGAAVGAAGAATVAASKVVGSAGHAVGSAANAGVNAAASAGGGLLKWWPLLAAGVAALFLLSYCNKGGDAAKQAADGAKNAAATATVSADTAAKAAADAAKATAEKAAADAAAAAKATADAAAKAAAEAVPAGAGLVGYLADGMPALKVYFDTGKTAVAKEFGDKSKDIVEFLKVNAGAKAIVTGYNDPTGNPKANAELSKNRAKGVAAGLKAAGIADDRVLLEKPANATAGAALSNAEARRVEVTIRK
jgi:uncharacterized protein YidB (DUF937 family)/outer membrane protein OmpA-like peptidoglycan-associated protein